MRRVVITGRGIVNPLGIGVDLVWKKILSGASGITSLNADEYSSIPCKVAGKVENNVVNLEKVFSSTQRRTCSRATLFALLAADEAIKDSKLLEGVGNDGQGFYEKDRIGVTIGMGMLDLQDIMDTGDILKTQGYNRLTPYFIPRILPNLAAGQISIKYGFQGPNHCASTACASGLHGVGDAYNLIRLNFADAIVAGGTEACINPLSIATFCRLRALSTKFNHDPAIASRPFDSDRDGFVMGEGSGVLVLEELQSALKRGANIYAEILGYGMTGDGHHMTAAREDGLGAYKAMKQALETAQMKPSDLSYINCHATSTPIGDKAEVNAIRKLVNDSKSLENIALSSTKGHHGHLLGAAGSVELIFTVQSVYKRTPPPSANIKSLDEEFSSLNIIQVKNTNVQFDKDRVVALKNSFGFGGTNASLCISNFIK